MARMIPVEDRMEYFNGSIGEMRAYEALKSLPDDCVVFHSLRYHDRHFRGESDFVVVVPGRGIIVIEVKDGEIAYRDGAWYQRNRKTGVEERMRKSPMAQAEIGKFAYLHLLDECESEYLRGLRVEMVVWYTSMEDYHAFEMPIEFNENVVFTLRDLDDVAGALGRAMDYYGFPQEIPHSQKDIDELVEVLAPEFNFVKSMAKVAGERDYLFNRLTREQGFLLDYLEEQRVAAIQGAGGTGKTMLAVFKAKRLAEDGPVLFLCFNNFLLKHLRELYGEEVEAKGGKAATKAQTNKKTGAAEGTGVVDFHNLYSLGKKMTFKDGLNEEDIIDFLNNYDNYNWKYKHIVIDEGQDFSDEQLGLLKTIADIHGGCFYVFYDKKQLVQRFEDVSWFDEVDCRLVLSRNCRNTFDIAQTSYRSIGIDKVKMNYNIEGEKPELIIAHGQERIVGAVAGLIKSYKEMGFEKNQITILTLKTEQTSVLAGLESVGGYRLCFDINDREILFTTARKFKGLESDIVIVVDMDAETFDDEETRRLFYVATSRAKNLLGIVADLSDEGIANLAFRLEGERRRNARIALNSTLKVKIRDFN